MCGGKPKGPVVATLTAGQYIPVKFEGSARHGGVLSFLLAISTMMCIGNLPVLPFL